MASKIGDAVSLSDPENEFTTPDDRQKIIKTMDGIHIEDYGHVAAGDTTSCEFVFYKTEWEKIISYWNNRKIVHVSYLSENFMARVVVKSHQHVKKFPNYYKATIEFWRV